MDQSEENKNKDFLQGIGEKKNPFSLPEGYFEKLPNEINKRITYGRISLKDKFFLFIMKPQVAIVAALVVLVCIGMLLMIPGNQNKPVGQKKQSDSIFSELAEKPDTLFQELATNVNKEDVKMRDLEPIESHVVIEEMTNSISEALPIEPDKEISLKSNEEINYLLDSDLNVYDIMDELNRD
jgi:hypothetical protein